MKRSMDDSLRLIIATETPASKLAKTRQRGPPLAVTGLIQSQGWFLVHPFPPYYGKPLPIARSDGASAVPVLGDLALDQSEVRSSRARSRQGRSPLSGDPYDGGGLGRRVRASGQDLGPEAVMTQLLACRGDLVLR